MKKAFINGLEAVIYDYDGEWVKCYIPEVGITDWYFGGLIEIR